MRHQEDMQMPAGFTVPDNVVAIKWKGQERRDTPAALLEYLRSIPADQQSAAVFVMKGESGAEVQGFAAVFFADFLGDFGLEGG